MDKLYIFVRILCFTQSAAMFILFKIDDLFKIFIIGLIINVLARLIDPFCSSINLMLAMPEDIPKIKLPSD
jgi:hypothetical protein